MAVDEAVEVRLGDPGREVGADGGDDGVEDGGRRVREVGLADGLAVLRGPTAV